MSNDYLNLNYQHIQEKYPLSLRKVEEWFSQKNDIAQGLKTLGVDVGTHAIGKVVAAVIQFDPRKLYDVFDDLGCRIFITDHGDTRREEKPLFYFYNSLGGVSSSCGSRREAESWAFMDAFRQMEKTLTDDQNKE